MANGMMCELEHLKEPTANNCEHGPGSVSRPKSASISSRLWRLMRSNLLMTLTLVGIVVGFTFGFTLREAQPSPSAIMWIGMPGTLFMRLLRMTIIPLVVSNVIVGAAAVDPKTNAKVFLVAVTLVIGTHLLTCSLATCVFVIFQPGASSVSSAASTIPTRAVGMQDIFADLLKNLVPDNVVEVTFRQVLTSYEPVTVDVVNSSITNHTSNATAAATERLKRVHSKVESTNVLGQSTAKVMEKQST